MRQSGTKGRMECRGREPIAKPRWELALLMRRQTRRLVTLEKQRCRRLREDQIKLGLKRARVLRALPTWRAEGSGRQHEVPTLQS